MNPLQTSVVLCCGWIRYRYCDRFHYSPTKGRKEKKKMGKSKTGTTRN